MHSDRAPCSRAGRVVGGRFGGVSRGRNFATRSRPTTAPARPVLASSFGFGHGPLTYSFWLGDHALGPRTIVSPTKCENGRVWSARTVMVDFARSVSRAGGSGATDFSLLIASPAPNLPRSSSSKPGMMLTAGRGAWRTGRAHPPSSRHQRSKLGSNCLGHRS